MVRILPDAVRGFARVYHDRTRLEGDPRSGAGGTCSDGSPHVRDDPSTSVSLHLGRRDYAAHTASKGPDALSRDEFFSKGQACLRSCTLAR